MGDIAIVGASDWREVFLVPTTVEQVGQETDISAG